MTETKVMDNTTTAKAVSPRRKMRGTQQHKPDEKAMVDAIRAIAF